MFFEVTCDPLSQKSTSAENNFGGYLYFIQADDGHLPEDDPVPWLVRSVLNDVEYAVNGFDA